LETESPEKEVAKKEEDIESIRARVTQLDKQVTDSGTRPRHVIQATMKRLRVEIEMGNYGVALTAINNILARPELVEDLMAECYTSGISVSDFIAEVLSQIRLDRDGKNKKPRHLRATKIMDAMNPEIIITKLIKSFLKLEQFQEIKEQNMRFKIRKNLIEMEPDLSYEELKVRRYLDIIKFSKSDETALTAIRALNEEIGERPHKIAPETDKETNITLNVVNYLGPKGEQKDEFVDGEIE
jgi:hypothetical protein